MIVIKELYELCEKKIIFFTSQIKQVCSKIQTNTNDLVGKCIGFHSFSRVYGSFHCHPCYVDHLIGKGVEPLPITNY